MKNSILLITFATLLVGCGSGANLSFSTVNGSCAAFNVESTTTIESAPGPYCMQVTITNNGSGQNFINSTTSAIQNITMNITGATNINSPATSSTTMDPNNCQVNAINPGSNCIFYLQISQESYPVNQAESVNLTLSYTVNNTLFGGSNTTGSSTLTLYEVTNLYLPQNNGYVSIFNSGSTPFKTVNALPSGGITTSAVDNSQFGYLYLSGGNGVYQYGEESATPSISPSGFTGASNLLNSAGNIYAAASNYTGIYQWSLSSNAWGNSNSSVFSLNPPLNANVHTVSPSGVLFFVASGISTNQVYSCTNSGSSTGSSIPCIARAVPFHGTIYTLAHISSSNSANTGLYAGASDGLYAEVKGATSDANTWTEINNPESQPIQTKINSLTTDTSGNLYAGDNSGTIWLLTNTSGAINQASPLYTLTGSGIQMMKVDYIANILYFVSTSGQLYSCYLGTPGTTPSCLPTVVPNSQILNNTVVGMKIASELRSSL